MVLKPVQNIMGDFEKLKEEAGIAACNFIKDGMKIGLGTGSTVRYTVIEIGRRISEDGLNVVGVPTSEATRELALEVGIPLVTLSESGGLDYVYIQKTFILLFPLTLIAALINQLIKLKWK